MAEKKGRFIIQEVKDRSPQVSPKRYDSYSLHKKVTMKSLGSYTNKIPASRSMSYVLDLEQNRWMSISQLWNNTMILFPNTTNIVFNQMKSVLKQPLREKLFLSSNDEKEEGMKSFKTISTINLIDNDQQLFPTIVELDNEAQSKSKAKANVNVNVSFNVNDANNGEENKNGNGQSIKMNMNKKQFNKQKTLAYPQSAIKSKTRIIFNTRTKKRRMTKTEGHLNLYPMNEECQKRISHQLLFRVHTGSNSIQLGLPSLSISNTHFSLIQSTPNKHKPTFQNLIICPIEINK